MMFNFTVSGVLPVSYTHLSIEHDVHGRQLPVYNMLKGMNKNENDTENLNIIPEHKWIDH